MCVVGACMVLSAVLVFALLRTPPRRRVSRDAEPGARPA